MSARAKHALRESVFEVLTCPVCGEYLSPPITLCHAGHNTCSRCRPNLQTCPRCMGPLLQTRNMALETIARGLRYPCRYTSAGCRHKSTMDEIGTHHTQCSHRSYNCPLRTFEGCYWTGRSPEIQEHVQKAHSSATVQQDTWHISNAECYQNSHHVVFALGEVFVLLKRFDIPQRKLCLAVQHCWEAQSHFRYSLQLEKNGGKQRALLSNAVHSHSESLEQVFLSGECIKVDFDMLMNFVKGTRTMSIVPVT